LDGAAIAAESGKDGAAIATQTPDGSSSGKLRKFPSTRSFSVANFNNQVNKCFECFVNLWKLYRQCFADPDPRIRASSYWNWIRIRILLFSSLTFKTPTKDYTVVFLLITVF
jgi:hypothetical protein